MIDRVGNLVIADSGNNRVREVAAADSTQWGVSMEREQHLQRRRQLGWFERPIRQRRPRDQRPSSIRLQRLALDPAGNLYIADAINNEVREVTPQPALHRSLSTRPRGGVTVSQSDGAQVSFIQPVSGA